MANVTGNVLVTGGAGFIGSHVVEQLVQEDYRVTVVDIRSRGRWMVDSNSVEYYWADLAGLPIIEDSPANLVTDIIHLAAWSNLRGSMTEPMELYRNNVMGSAKVVELALQAAERGRPLRSVVFASSSAAYLPVSHYGVSKAAGEEMMAVLSTQCPQTAVCLLRLANVYGPRQNPKNGTVIARWVESLFTGEQPVMYGDGTMSRDYVDVRSVADAFVTAMRERICESHLGGDGLTTFGHSTHEVATGISTTLTQLEIYMSAAAKRKQMPMLPMLTQEVRPGDVRKVNMEMSAMLRSYGWNPPKHVKRGLEQVIEWRSQMEGSWEDNHLTTGQVVDRAGG